MLHPNAKANQVLLDSDFCALGWSKTPVGLNSGHLNQALNATEGWRNVGDLDAVDELGGRPEVPLDLRARWRACSSVSRFAGEILLATQFRTSKYCKPVTDLKADNTSEARHLLLCDGMVRVALKARVPERQQRGKVYKSRLQSYNTL